MFTRYSIFKLRVIVSICKIKYSFWKFISDLTEPKVKD